MTAIPEDSDYAGMTLTEIERKHYRLRGTDTLKYPPTRRERCQSTCGLGDMMEGWGEHKKYEMHQCFLTPEHKDDCEFSSECGKSEVAQ